MYHFILWPAMWFIITLFYFLKKIFSILNICICIWVGNTLIRIRNQSNTEKHRGKFYSRSCPHFLISAPISLRVVIFISFFCISSVFLMHTAKMCLNYFPSFLTKKVTQNIHCSIFYLIWFDCCIMFYYANISVLFIYSPV